MTEVALSPSKPPDVTQFDFHATLINGFVKDLLKIDPLAAIGDSQIDLIAFVPAKPEKAYRWTGGDTPPQDRACVPVYLPFNIGMNILQVGYP